MTIDTLGILDWIRPSERGALIACLNDPLRNEVPPRADVWLAEIVSTVINNLCNDEEGLNYVCSRSYNHPLGFTKFVLADLASGEQLRLHYWPRKARFLEDAHDHYWPFRSIILRGGLLFREYAEVMSTQEAVKCTKFEMQQIYRKCAYSGISVGERFLMPQRVIYATKGSSYVIASPIVHNTTTCEGAISLVFQGRRTQETNVVYRFEGSGHQFLDGADQMTKHDMTKTEVINILHDIEKILIYE